MRKKVGIIRKQITTIDGEYMRKTKLLLVSAFAFGVLVSISSCSDDEKK